MQEAISPYVPFIVFIIAGIIISIFRDQNCRKVKDSVTQKIERNKTKVVYLDTKVTWKATSFLSFHIQWENAEVIITKGSILYFSYFSFLGHRFYSQARHWHFGNEAIIPRQIRRSTPVKSFKITGGNLVIDSLVKHAKISTTIKDVTSSGKLETIRKMLNISRAQYQLD